MRRPLSSARLAHGGISFAKCVALGVVMLASVGARSSAQTLQFRQLTPDNGLSSSLVGSIIQDSRGFIWLGTKKGVNRYDGNTVVVYRHRAGDSTSVIDNEATTLYEDAHKTVWVGTPLGLSRYVRDRDAFHSYEVVPGDTVAVSAILEAQGTLWLGTRRGLYTFDRTTGKAVPYSSELSRVDVRGLFEDRDHHLWLGTKGGGAREIDLRTGRVKVWMAGKDVRQFVEDAEGALYVAVMDGGLAKIDRTSGSVTRYVHDDDDPNSLTIDAVHSLLLDGTRGLWVGTENGGLDYFDFVTRRFRHNRFDPNKPSGLNSNSIWALFADPSGTLWVGTYAGGVNISRQNGDAIRRYRFVVGDPTSLSFNSVMAFLEDSGGIIWVATDGGGLNRFDRATGTFRRYTSQTSNLNSDAVLSLTEDKLGKIWLATWGGGVSRFDPLTGRFTAFTPKNSGMADNQAFSIFADRAGSVWVGTLTHGLQRVDPATGVFSTPIPLGNGLESEVRVIMELSDGVLLVGTTANMTSMGGGMIEFDPRTGTKRSYTAGRDGISGNVVNSIVEGPSGIVWIGTSNGLDRLDRRTGKIDHFTDADGLPGATVNAIVLDASRGVWVSGDQGIARFDPTARRSKRYTVADGLQGSEFNFTASYRTRDDAILFGGSQGFNVIEPERIAENGHVPPIVFTGFQLANKPVTIGAPGSPLARHITEARSITVRYDQSFTIEFAALDFVAPDKNRYAYKLDGLDRDWNESGTKHAASYTSLPPGSYTFRAKGTNNDGLWNETGAAIEIIVTPPFWGTWWFRALFALIVIGIVAAIVRIAQVRHRTLQVLHERDRESQQYLERNVLDILGA
ncbi:MAG: two-component regulator propeller domain-containing protein, partial [bacterium]